MKTYKINKGITLIALIITIIILLILAGITITQLTGNGLFGKAKIAKQKTRYVSAKEIVNLKLMEIQVDCTENNEEYNIIKIAEGMKKAENITIEKYYNKETASIKEGVTENTTNLEGIVVSVNEYSEYKFLIGESCEIIGVLEGRITNTTGMEDFIDLETFETSEFGSEVTETSSIKFSYELGAYENNKFKILIKVLDENGIDIIQFPDGDILNCKGREEVAIDYEVDEGVDYIFVAKNSNGNERKEVINFIKPAEPEINIPNIETPTFTVTGVENEIPKITIKYDERKQFLNYYSIDNGQTWVLYTGPITVSTENIKAKSESRKCIGLFTEKTAIIEQLNNTLKVAGYDGNLDTASDCPYINQPYGELGHGYNFDFKVDSSTWGSFCSIISRNTAMYGYGRTESIEILDENGKLIEKKSIEICTDIKYDIKFEIPINAYTVVFSSQYSERYVVYEVSINEPIMPRIRVEYEEEKAHKSVLEYPVLTLNGVGNCSVNPELGSKMKLEIQTKQLEGVEIYYSLDGGNTWNIYTNIIETTYKGEGLIQTKSVNKYYNTQSDINILKNYINDQEVTCTGTNAVQNKGFDGDWESSTNLNHYSTMYVDESFSRKEVIN